MTVWDWATRLSPGSQPKTDMCWFNFPLSLENAHSIATHTHTHSSSATHLFPAASSSVLVPASEALVAAAVAALVAAALAAAAGIPPSKSQASDSESKT